MTIDLASTVRELHVVHQFIGWVDQGVDRSSDSLIRLVNNVRLAW